MREGNLTLAEDDDVDIGILGTDDYKVMALKDQIASDGHALVVQPPAAM